MDCLKGCFGALLMLAASIFGFINMSQAGDLDEVRKSGVLRHLSVPYANFNTGSGDGLDIELMQMFAKHLGVQYQYVETSWGNILPDLVGHSFQVAGEDVIAQKSTDIRGDVIANGLTILAWREKLVDFSIPTFPSGVWLITRAENALRPIEAGESESQDILKVKSAIKNMTVMGIDNTCLDYRLYDLKSTGAKVVSFSPDEKQVNELVPSLLNGEVDSTLLDVPDALVALRRWPAQIKVIGPVSGEQKMGVAFRKGADDLRKAFNSFYRSLVLSGQYDILVNKYYPDVEVYFDGFFEKQL